MTETPFDKYPKEYENWFKENDTIFQSELNAIKSILPKGNGLEIGIGSGIFAEKLNVKHGIDPSEEMLKIAKSRGLDVESGIAEKLPYEDNSFDFALFITSLCFVQDPLQALMEAKRVIKETGTIIIAFVDKNSQIGKSVTAKKDKSKFYENANLLSVEEVLKLLKSAGFETKKIIQTLTNPDPSKPETPKTGYGEGSFVVVSGCLILDA